MDQPEILLVAFSLAGLTFFLSPLMMTLQKRELVAWSIILRNDSVITMIGIGTVSSVQILLEFVQKLIAESAGSSLTTSGLAYAAIMAQLVAIDSALVAIVGIVSTIPALQGFSIMIGQMLSGPISAVTGAIILWTLLQILSNVIPGLFLTLFSIGLVLFSIPFRMGRQAGSSMMALSMVLFIGLPLAAPAAIWLESYVMTSDDLSNLTGLSKKIQLNLLDPLFLTKLIAVNLSELVARLLAGLIIALIVFPVMYLALLGIFARSLATLLGGSSSFLPIRGV